MPFASDQRYSIQCLIVNLLLYLESVQLILFALDLIAMQKTINDRQIHYRSTLAQTHFLEDQSIRLMPVHLPEHPY